MGGRRKRRKRNVEKAPAADRKSEAAGRAVGWRRRWTFRLIALTVVPAAILLALEGGLRLFGYGRPTGFSLEQEVNGRAAYVFNPYFSRRFFPPQLARRPDFSAYPKAKGETTYRIFMLGASAARGDPDPAYGFARILRTMLRDRYPQTRFEVINTAMTAINSHVVREIAADCAGRDADLLIVYLGNNEIVGPFGPGNSLVPLSRSRTLIRAKLWVGSTRIGQAMTDLLAGRPKGPPVWRGMEMFLDRQVRADDPSLESVYGHFQANLTEICDAAERPGSPLILCTVAVNLRDCAPFASLHREDLTAGERGEWDARYRQGIAQQQAGRFAQAIDRYSAAAAIDRQYAELHYRLGHCQWHAQRSDEARKSFQKARDLDTLRFRADTRINEIIRAVAGAHADRGVHLLDTEAVLEAGSPHGIPGRELFYEHVHFNFAGDYLVAEALFRQIESILPEPIRRTQPAHPLPSADECARRLAFTDYDRSRVLGLVADQLGRAPFADQYDVGERLARVQRQIDRLRPADLPRAITEGVAMYNRAIDADPSDPALRKRFGEYLLKLGGPPAMAEEHFREALKLGPAVADELHVNLAAALAAAGRPAEAINHLRRAIAITPNEPLARAQLGLLLCEQGKPRQAIEQYEAAIELLPDYPFPLMLLAALLATSPREEIRDGPRAVALGERACRATEWKDAKALDALAAAYAEVGRFDDAVATAEKALKRLPPEDSATIDAVRARIRRYEAGEPFRAKSVKL